MASVNKVIIVGNLGADPEVKTFDNGGKIANISVATTDRWTDRNTGEQREATEWHRITFNDRLADVVAQYLRKGSQVYVEGSLRTRKWQDPQTGQDRYTTEIRATSMQMLGSRQGGNDGHQGGGFGGGYQGGNGYQNNYQGGNFGNQNNQGYQNRNNFQNANQPMNSPNNDYPYGNDGGFNPQGNFGNQNPQGYQNQGYPQTNSFGSPNQMQQPMAQAPMAGVTPQPQAPRPTPQEPKAPSAPQVSNNIQDDDMPF